MPMVVYEEAAVACDKGPTTVRCGCILPSYQSENRTSHHILNVRGNAVVSPKDCRRGIVQFAAVYFQKR